jgi:hypothetical protein
MIMPVTVGLQFHAGRINKTGNDVSVRAMAEVVSSGFGLTSVCLRFVGDSVYSVSRIPSVRRTRSLTSHRH